jgi:GntR family transcriptional repressor for pyruvate dehydrogenase complex
MSDVLQVNRRVNLDLRVAEALVEQLRAGRWAPGDRLPPEHELAAMLGVSRPSVREGLRRLQAHGLVRVEHGRGAFVLEPQAVQLLPTPVLSLILASPARAAEVHEARLPLELGLTELAAQRATEDDLARLRSLLEQARALIESSEPSANEQQLFKLGFDFHLALAAAAHSPLLSSLYELLVEPLYRTVERPHATAGNPREDLDFHQAIVDAVERGDVPAALQAARDHILCTARLGLGPEKEQQVPSGG